MLKLGLIIVHINACIGLYYFKMHQTEQVQIPLFQRYFVDDLQYLLFTKEVGWNEAKYICLAFNGQLAVLNTMPNLKKLASAIQDFYELWIGGYMYDDYRWMWINSSQLFSSRMLRSPYWLRKPFNAHKKCLAVDLRHDDPVYINLNCRLRRPFLCETDLDNQVQYPTIQPHQRMSIGNQSFVFYNQKMTWTDAIAFCHLMDLHLATMETVETIKRIGYAMLQNRPILDEIWVSAYLDNTVWKWLPTLELFEWPIHGQNQPNNLKYSTSKPCISFGKYYNKFNFIPKNCNIRKAFLCKEDSSEPTIAREVQTIKLGKLNFSLVLKALRWLEAKKYCEASDGHLVELVRSEDLETISTVLANQPEEISNIWVGGIYKNGKWIWDQSNNHIQRQDVSLDDNYDEMSCLSLDIEYEMKMYGIRCDVTQFFMCVNYT